MFEARHFDRHVARFGGSVSEIFASGHDLAAAQQVEASPLGEWPERLWRCFEVLIELIVSNPAISHLRLVECYAAGPEAIRRAEEITRSFTMFLQEGRRYRPAAHTLPRLAEEAIAGAIFEIIQREVAQGRIATLKMQLPVLTYIALAPFTGP